MKKAAIILLLVALVALLTGCGNKDPFPGVRNPVATPEWEAAYQKLLSLM